MKRFSSCLWFAILFSLFCVENTLLPQEVELGLHSDEGVENPPDFSLLSESRWQQIESSVDRGIEWLVANQRPDGSYPGAVLEQTAITSLAAMAIMSRGHTPGIGREGKAIDRSIDYVLRAQKSDGLLSHQMQDYGGAIARPDGMTYCHGISGLFLCEVYGMTSPERSQRIEVAIELALNFMRKRQLRPLPASRETLDRGGWRYLKTSFSDGCYSDLSITSWMVMFMRSAENAGFSVPFEWADQALKYVRRSYDPTSGGFHYDLFNPQKITRGMTGAGVLCLFLTGNREPEMERGAGVYLRRYPFDEYNKGMNSNDRYLYSAYYCSQASMQLGGETWATIYPSIVTPFLANQIDDGRWPLPKRHSWTGYTYSTSMAILSLTPPYQLLPIYQR